MTTPKEEQKHTLLPLMKENRIFYVSKLKSGNFQIVEGCDDYFIHELTPLELAKLGDELIALSDTRKADCHEELEVGRSLEKVQQHVMIVRKALINEDAEAIHALEQICIHMNTEKAIARATNHQESGEK